MTQTIELEPVLKYSKKQIQKAGEYLITKNADTNTEKYNEQMEVLSYWRSAHAPALEATVNLLTRECKKHDTHALIASRLKRTPSIIGKLRRFDEMKLRNMQDIGGCRAVLKNTKTLNRIYKELNKGGELNHKNYIKNPKPDGYRGIHIIRPVQTLKTQFRIEIQLRTKAQHAWSTAVEIIDLFTNQNLKGSKGKDEWLAFFKAASIEIEKLENGIIPSQCESLKNFMSLLRSMDIKKRFAKLSALVDKINCPDEPGTGEYVLISLTKNSQTIEIKRFKTNQFNEATKEYLKLEKKIKKTDSEVAALVSLNSLHNLKDAYPNYFADSKYFIELLSKIEAYGEVFYPSNLLYRVLSAAGFGKSEKERMAEALSNTRINY